MNVKTEIEIKDEDLGSEYNSYEQNIQIFPDDETDFASQYNIKTEALDEASAIKAELREIKKEPMSSEEQYNNDVLKSEMSGKKFSFQQTKTTAKFYNKDDAFSRWIAPQQGEDSDIELEDDDLDDRTIDSEYQNPDDDDDDLAPTISSDCVARVRPEQLPQDDSDEEEEGQKMRKKARISYTKLFAHPRKWKKEDISHPSLPDYCHPTPECLREPFQYFQDFFTINLLEEIVYQTNLYAKQKDVETSFVTNAYELMNFIGIVIYMGVTHLPNIEDYWSSATRVQQVADTMSLKRFRLLRSLLHFNNNENVHSSTDRFFKVRPLFSHVTEQFQNVAETPTQSVDEVMVAYKGTRAGSFRQYMQNKPDKWGYKLFCRASIDGFIHDILLYQGETTFSCHHSVELNQEESLFPVSNKTVIALAKTLKNPSKSVIYADNWFTSIGLVEYLRKQFGCRYVGTARTNRIGDPPLTSVKGMEIVPRGEHEYYSTNGILAIRWKDNEVVTVISSDVGVEPVKTVMSYDKKHKKKVEISCPSVIKEYNGKMRGIDKSNMLTHLYKSPMRARRWYLKLFGYILDLCICNAWLLYKRDCKALKENPMPLKLFRIDISKNARCQKSDISGLTRFSLQQECMELKKRGQKTNIPHDNQRYDTREWHMPIYVTNRQTCKHCCKKDNIHRTRWMCTSCKVGLCLSESRNCFIDFHTFPQCKLSLANSSLSSSII